MHLDEPEPPGRFLGCYQHYFTSTAKKLTLILSSSPRVRLKSEKPVEKVFEDPNHEVRGYSYDMTQYLEKAVDKFLALIGAQRKVLRRAKTTFMDGSKDPQGCIPMDSTLPENQVRGELAKQALSIDVDVLCTTRKA